VTVNRWKK